MTVIEHGLAVPSCSPWSSPCILVPKPDGTSNFFTDYRKIHMLMVPDLFPMPRVTGRLEEGRLSQKCEESALLFRSLIKCWCSGDEV